MEGNGREVMALDLIGRVEEFELLICRSTALYSCDDGVDDDVGGET